MSRAAFQALADLRVADAAALLDAGRYQAAYYIAGYAVECALKARIARETAEYDFPAKDTQKFYVHSPTKLLSFAGLANQLNTDAQADPELAANWGTVSLWGEEYRYESGITEQDARGLFEAISDAHHGVLQWLKLHW